MKIIAVPLALLFTASVMSAQAPAPAPAPTAPAAKPAETKVAPAKPADPKAKVAPKKEEKKKEPVYTIAGATIPRANGTFLGLEVVDGNFKLSFYDKKKKPMAPDVTRANAVWPNKHSGTPSEFRTVLNPSGNSLVGSKTVKPPYILIVRITLLQGDGDAAVAVENYSVSFSG